MGFLVFLAVAYVVPTLVVTVWDLFTSHDKIVSDSFKVGLSWPQLVVNYFK